jgi:MOSC domain-containing protein YiiM
VVPCPAATLLAVSVVHTVRPDAGYPGNLTAIDKRAVEGRVVVRTLGVDGDRQMDTRDHGGPDKAVYAYAVEDARWWERELDRPLHAGAFGENLTTEGPRRHGRGDRRTLAHRHGEVQVVSPRIPCRTFAAFWDVPDLVKRFTAHGAPGAYLRVTREGEVGAGDRVEVVDRPAHGLTVGEVFRARSGERALVPRMLEADDLDDDLKAWARRILARRPSARS